MLLGKSSDFQLSHRVGLSCDQVVSVANARKGYRCRHLFHAGNLVGIHLPEGFLLKPSHEFRRFVGEDELVARALQMHGKRAFINCRDIMNAQRASQLLL